jgi:threonine/homoserine/homoserine lactone efflux protein
MTADLLLALIAFAFVTSVTPGPNNMMLLASGVNFGFRKTIPHMLGIGIGFGFMLLMVGLGIGQVFVQFPQAYTALKVISVIYMLWLAWKIANAGPVKAADGQPDAKPMTFLQAAAFQWVNPKAWTMSLTAMSAYTVPSQYFVSVAVVALVFAIVNLPTVSSWTLFGVGLRRLLADPVRVRIFNICMALLLVASLWPIIAEYVRFTA